MRPDHLRNPITCDISLVRITIVPWTARAYLQKEDHYQQLSQFQLHYCKARTFEIRERAVCSRRE
jgi:hypothetical protein